MPPSTSQFLRSFFLLTLTSLFLAGCSSDETADSGTGAGGIPAAVDTGDVTLLLTDAPTSLYDEVNVTAEQVSLVDGDREEPLMSRSQRFNLLDLRNTFRKLSRCKARVGTYSGVRFRIRDVELVKRDELGNIVERVIPRLESNMVNLNARTQFAVDRLRQLVVKLDLDADASLGTDPTAVDPDNDNPDGVVFDPDATVDVDSVPTDTTAPPQEVTPVLMNQQGRALDIQADTFQLCDPAVLTDCVQVNVSPDTVLLSNQLQPITIDAIVTDPQVQVLGHLDVTTGAIDALHVLQTGAAVSTYAGMFSGAAVNDAIDFEITAGTSAGVPATVPLASMPGIYDSAGKLLGLDALADGVNAEVIGILNRGLLSSTLTPGVIIIAPPATP